MREARISGLALVLCSACTVLLFAGIVQAIPPSDEGSDPLPNAFASSGLTVPRSEIIAGGPPRDGIRAVSNPVFVTAGEAVRWVKDEHAVVGVVVGDEARAYPVHILEFHQVINGRLGDLDTVVTYDPLTDVARAYGATARAASKGAVAPSKPAAVSGAAADPGFGVSGLIYQCGFLLYDRATQSLWRQWNGRALAGPRAGEQLAMLPVRVEPLGAWRARHPATLVLRPPEPKRFDYRYSNYTSYWVSDKIPFPVEHIDPRIHPKELVLGVRVGGKARAYLAGAIAQHGGRVVDEFGGQRIRIQYDETSGTFIYDTDVSVEAVAAYWFAWKNFEPETDVWKMEQMSPPRETAPPSAR